MYGELHTRLIFHISVFHFFTPPCPGTWYEGGHVAVHIVVFLHNFASKHSKRSVSLLDVRVAHVFSSWRSWWDVGQSRCFISVHLISSFRMCLVRMRQEGRTGKYMCRYIVHSMWEDVNQRSKIMGVGPLCVYTVLHVYLHVLVKVSQQD